MQTAKRVKRPSDVARIKFSRSGKGKLVKIGGHGYGRIYLGRLRFKGNEWKRVAIKVFKSQLAPYKVKLYRKCIEDLRRAGVKLPKMNFVKMKTKRAPKGEWVQVSQLFGSTGKGSKIKNKSWANLRRNSAIVEAVVELTKAANAGYYPVEDLIEPFKKDTTKIIPIDVDSFVEDRIRNGRPTVYERANYLAEVIDQMAKGISNKKYKALYAVAEKAASPSLKKALKKFTPAFDKI